jgi:membrane protein DedA with SNARE-associated domain
MTLHHLHAGTAVLASLTTRILDRVLVLHGVVAYLVVGALCFGEAAVMLGFVIPGETAVIIGGVLASRHHVTLSTMIAVVIVSAIVGDSVGYEVGKHLGPRILALRPLRKRAVIIERGREFLRRRGVIGVFLGRFTAFLRAMVPGLAGMSGMRYSRFLAANATGGIVWGTTYTLLGYFIGTSIENVTGPASLALLGAIVLVVVALHLRSRAKKRRFETAMEHAGEPETDADAGANDRA